MVPSKALKDPRSTCWCRTMEEVEPIANALTSIIAPDIYHAGCNSIKEIKQTQLSKHTGESYMENVSRWPSIYSGISVICNRTTEYHTDRGAYPSAFDLLLSCGTHLHCQIDVLELGASFPYNPGTALAMNGWFLQHGVKDWVGGDRVCYAHYIKKNVHHRTKVEEAGWQNISMFQKILSL